MASKMVDMMLSPDELKEQYGQPTVATDEQEKYPWGLRISLGNDELKKLGITKLPEAGQPFTIEAIGYVCDAGSSDTVDGGKRLNMCIQITDMDLEEGVEDEDEPDEGERAQRMYPEGSGEKK